MWGAFVALLLALSPVTGAKRVIPSLVLGVAGAGLVLGGRLRHRAVEGARSRGAAVAVPGAAVAAVLLGAFALFAPTAAWLYGEYTDSIWRNPHGLFVPLFAVLLARHTLREDADPQPRSSAWGFALLGPACLLVVLDAGIRSHYIALAGLLLALPGLSLLLLGTRRTRRLAFPLLLTAFMIPLPQGLGDPLFLPTLSAEVGRTLVDAMGVPAVRIGTRLQIAGGIAIEVSQNCSGLSFFYGGCALAALCIGVTRSWPRRVALVAAPYLLTALGNGLRVAFLLVAGQRIGLDWKYTTPIHGMIGTGVFLAVMAGIWLLSDRKALREALT